MGWGSAMGTVYDSLAAGRACKKGGESHSCCPRKQGTQRYPKARKRVVFRHCCVIFGTSSVVN